MTYPPKPRPGDRVAVLSPSAGLPAIFPDVYELGLRRPRDLLGLEPVEYMEVYRILRNMGERGLLAQFPAVLVGRAKAWDRAQPNPPEVKRAYVAAQRAAVRKALAQYAPEAVVVFDLDIGHIDP
jgi:hypothetical protein